jgi:hypothetical protein
LIAIFTGVPAGTMASPAAPVPAPQEPSPAIRSGSQQGAKHEAHEAHPTAPTAKVDVAVAMWPLASSPLGVAATRALLYEVAMANHARPTAKAVTYT